MPKKVQKTVSQMICRKIKPQANRFHEPCGKSLFLTVQPTGSKSWTFFYRYGGKHCSLRLGSFLDVDESENKDEPTWGGKLTLSGAQSLAGIAISDLKRKVDPAIRKRTVEAAVETAAAEAKAVEAAEAAERGPLFKEVAAQFVTEKRELGKRSADEYERLLRTLTFEDWGNRPIKEITRTDVKGLLRKLRGRGMTGGTVKLLAVLTALMNWAIEEEIILASPCRKIKQPIEVKPRERFLSRDEIRWFWLATDRLGYPFRDLFRLLLLTGQRRDEVADMTRAELNMEARLWTIPEARAKNKKEHVVPLSDAVLGVLAGMEKIYSKKGFLLTTTGKSGVSGFSKAKTMLDREMLKIAREETGNKKLKIEPWWGHDLRRSCATYMVGELHIAESHVARVLNHITEVKRTVTGKVYIQHDYLPEKRGALQAWGNYVLTLCEGKPADNVEELRRGTAA
jgi:integrase